MKSFLNLKILIIILLFSTIAYSGYSFIKNFDNKATDNDNPSEIQDLSLEKKYWKEKINQIGPQETYLKFKEEYRDKIFNIQHNKSHMFGEILYQTSGISGITICDQSFSFGCYHSFFAAIISDRGISVISDLGKECEKKYKNNSSPCFHGIGHGLMEYYGEKKLLDALRGCQMIASSTPFFGCNSGVFMEYNVPIIIDGANIYTEYRKLDEKNPYDPCPNLPSEFKNACYHELPQLWERVFNENQEKVVNLCEKILDSEMRLACFDGYGGVAAPQSNFDEKKTRELCNLSKNIEGNIMCKIRASWTFKEMEKYSHLASYICADLSYEDKKLCAE